MVKTGMEQDSQILLKYGQKTAGALLAEARACRSLSIGDIEQILKIKARHIEAIEADDHDGLPGRVYAIGFIRSYAEYMGFDPDEVIELFKMKSIGHHTDITLPRHGDVLIVSQTPSLILIIVCIVGLCVIGIGFGTANTVKTSSDLYQIPDVPKDLSATLEQTMIVSYTEKHHEEVVSKKAKTVERSLENVVVIKAIYDSWIKVSDSTGKSIYSGILQMGTRYDVPSGDGYRLMTGNAGGTEILINGKSVGVLGQVSEVKKHISLEEKNLRSLSKKSM